MFSDSAKTTETTIGDAKPRVDVKYERTNKIYSFPGHGCVTIWGCLHSMQPRLRLLEATFRGDGLIALKDRVLKEIKALAQDDGPLTDSSEPYPEVGCHVAGFVDDKPYLWHVFWGKSQPPASGEVPAIHDQNESHLFALYNGRNDYVHRLVSMFREEDRAPALSLHSAWDRILIGAHIVAFITQLTRDVSKPVRVAIIRPDNKIETLGLDQLAAPPPEATKRHFKSFLDSGA